MRLSICSKTVFENVMNFVDRRMRQYDRCCLNEILCSRWTGANPGILFLLECILNPVWCCRSRNIGRRILLESFEANVLHRTATRDLPWNGVSFFSLQNWSTNGWSIRHIFRFVFKNVYFVVRLVVMVVNISAQVQSLRWLHNPSKTPPFGFGEGE